MSLVLLQRLVAKCITTGAMRKAITALQEVLQLQAAAKGTGRRAKTPRSAKGKGREGVVAAKAWIHTLLPQLDDDDILIQTTSVGGSDLHYSPVARRLFPFAPESKRVEALNVWEALKQAEINAVKRGLAPVLFFSRGGSKLYVAFEATDLRTFLQTHDLRWHEQSSTGRTQDPTSPEQAQPSPGVHQGGD